MKRLLVLLLICLLPMQVFAGMVTFKVATASQTRLGTMPGVDVASADDKGDQHVLGDNADAGADNDDFSNHATIGDEPVMHLAQLFVVDAATLAPALRSDAACQPPFLPPAGRPPRI